MRTGQVPEDRMSDKFAAATAELRMLGAFYGSEQFVTNPTVMSWEAARRVERACQTVMRGLDALRDIACGGDLHELARLSRVPLHAIPALKLMDEEWAAIARPDILLNDDGEWVIELNCGSPAGQYAMHDVMVRAQCALPSVREKLTALEARPAAVVPHLAATLKAASVLSGGAVAISYWGREDHAQKAPVWMWYYRCLAAELERNGILPVTCPVEALTLRSDSVSLGKVGVGVLYRFFEFPVSGAANELRLLSDIFAAARNGTVGLFTGYRGALLADKTCLALLSDERTVNLLDPELATELSRCIPWTRILEHRSTMYKDTRVDLLPFVLQQRTKMVIKRTASAVGSAVLIGRELSPGEWRAAVDRAVRDTSNDTAWVVQEVIETASETVTMIEYPGEEHDIEAQAVYGAFMLHRRLTGMMKRYGMAPDRSININPRTGFAPAPVYWTDLPE